MPTQSYRNAGPPGRDRAQRRADRLASLTGLRVCQHKPGHYGLLAMARWG
jgi:hypothetical protein